MWERLRTTVDSVRGTLLLRVFLANTAVLVLALVVLSASPLTVSSPVVFAEAALLATGFGVLIFVNFVVLRRVFAPLAQLTGDMRRVDLMRPGLRVETSSDRHEVVALTKAFNEMLERLEDERRSSVRAALGAQEGERQRVAQELHDEIGQSLTAISLRLEAARREPAGPSRDDLREIQEIAVSSVDQVREIARGLRPEMLDDLGLASALVALTERVASNGDLEVRRDVDRALPHLGDEIELVVFRVAQESLTNVIRHSGARTVSVSLSPGADGGVTLIVEDDGQGMPAAVEPGTGMQGMLERAVLIGATLDFEDAPGGGTRVVLRVPRATSGDGR
jgi:two-component system, NarL family, sensor histidine kinase UhpB